MTRYNNGLWVEMRRFATGAVRKADRGFMPTAYDDGVRLGGRWGARDGCSSLDASVTGWRSLPLWGISCTAMGTLALRAIS